MIFFVGAILVYTSDPTHSDDCIKNCYQDNDIIIAKLNEPLSEKEKTFKAEASVTALIGKNNKQDVKGSILIYFQKDPSLSSIGYGSQIVFKKSLQLIKNAGNPGSFDYQRYCAFNNIYYQVYLKSKDFILMDQKEEDPITKFLFYARSKTIAIFQKYIPGEKEKGFAEALLIGYRDDLDKTLVQSYTNTGVVHIIAISGMQLALIYVFLLLIFKPFAKFRLTKILRPITILATLWLFSLMSGASPSVLRAAVMFTCIIIGESFLKRASIYNNLAASAFLLLCYNPFWLWDVGFQLSYIAVLSIVIFMKPIYNLFYIQNKTLDFIWQLISVSIAAQILTTPISIFQFHQFPVYFLLTNLIAVPLSSIVLFGELILCAVSFIPVVAKFFGVILNWLIWLLNSFIEHMETLPLSIWSNLQISILQTICCYIIIAGISMWIFFKNRSSLIIAFSAMLCFVMLRTFSFWQVSDQQKIIVYNVPQHQAIDFISGRDFMFKTDSGLYANNSLQNFYLRSSRMSQRISLCDSLASFNYGYSIFQFSTKKILLIDKPILFQAPGNKIAVDAIIISKNPKIKIANLASVFNCNEWIFDASNASWNINKWKKECDGLDLPYYDVNEKGAFVMNVD
jgi:competence protein ComEC